MAKGKRNLLLGAAAALLLAAAALWVLPDPRGPAIRVGEARIGPAVEAVYATGTVEPRHWARIRPVVSARIVAVEVEEGDRVAAGDVLVRLDDRHARATLAEREAALRFLKSELARTEELARRGIVSSRVEERAQSDLDKAEAELAAAREELSRYVVQAPSAGVVLRRDGEPGEIVGPADTVAWIGEPVPLRVVAEVDEKDIPRVEPGQEVLVEADAFRGRALEARVASVTPFGDTASKTYRVRISLPDDTPLRPGMTVEVNIVVRRDDRAVLVPEEALAQGRVFVVEDGRARARAVGTGVVGNGWAEIVSGLAEGDAVVLSPPAGLSDGGRVRASGRT